MAFRIVVHELVLMMIMMMHLGRNADQVARNGRCCGGNQMHQIRVLPPRQRSKPLIIDRVIPV